MTEIQWDICREGRRWTVPELRARYDLAPEKIEVIDGRLLWSDEERLQLLGLLLENIGLDAAVRLGDASAWRAAIRDLR